MMTTLDETLKELSSAEDFLEFFKIEYDAHLVQVNRLHILQRCHDYLEQAQQPLDEMHYAQSSKLMKIFCTLMR